MMILRVEDIALAISSWVDRNHFRECAMRKLLLTVIRILDGTPAVYGRRQSGQSVVELALITPILIVMLAGLTEIGWFANNYLNLLDVTRAGARRATTFTDQLSPLSWNNIHTYVPNSWLPSAEYHMPENPANGDNDARLRSRNYNPVTGLCTETVPNFSDAIGFYDSVICIMLRSMPPLRLEDNNVDDIIISGFAVARVDPRRNNPARPGGAGGDPPWLGANRPIPADVPQMVVVGRYPTNANECDVTEDTSGAAQLAPLEPRDPFDFNENNRIDRALLPGSPAINPLTEVENEYSEIVGYDPIAGTIADAEKQVGFSWFGHHRIPGTRCIGSLWTMQRVEQLMNLPNFDLNSPLGASDQSRRERLPNQGIVIVEMHWQHRLLLNLPFFTALGEMPVINVWAAFPLPTVEPYIAFP
jgi:hypothetical protein